MRSHKLAKTATQALHTHLAKAQAELGRLTEHKQGKKRYADGAALQQAAVDEQAVAAAVRRLGWRVYVTNHATEVLSQAILAYREEYPVEHGFGRVIGKLLSLSPMDVQSDQRATGLVCLLSIGLRVLTLLEFRVRQRLADTQERLAGLYAGNPKRTTPRPTAEALLGAFQGIHWDVARRPPSFIRGNTHQAKEG